MWTIAVFKWYTLCHHSLLLCGFYTREGRHMLLSVCFNKCINYLAVLDSFVCLLKLHVHINNLIVYSTPWYTASIFSFSAMLIYCVY